MTPTAWAGDSVLLALLVLGTVGALTAAALTVVVALKRRRDRVEAASIRRRDSMRLALATMDRGALRSAVSDVDLTRTPDQVDLLAALRTVTPESWQVPEALASARDVLQEHDLAAHLLRQLHDRRAERRGLAVLLGSYPCCPLPATDLAGLMEDTNPSVRLAAAAALEHLATPEAAHLLISALERGVLPDPRLIERLGHLWAAPYCRNALRSVTGDGVTRVRAALARALGLAGDTAAVPDLLWLLDIGDDDEQIQSLRALGMIAPGANPDQRADIAAAARRASTSSNGVVVLMATQALGATGTVDDVPELTELLQSPDWHVRRAAARALSVLGPVGVAALFAAAEGPDRYAADRAREELALVGLTEPRPPEGLP